MSQRPARRTRSGARHLAIALAHWAGGHTVSNEELLRRIVKARAEAHQEALEEHRRLVLKAHKKATKLTRIAEEDGGLTPAAKAQLKAAVKEAERHTTALRALGEFEVPSLDPGQVRHRRQRIAAARCAVLAAPAAGIATLSVTTAAWWAAPAAAALGMVGAWVRGPRPYDLTVRPVPADLIAETPMVIPPAPHAAVPAGAAPVAGLLAPPMPATAPPGAATVPVAPGGGGAPADETGQHLVLGLSKALSACRVIPRGRQVALLAAPEITAERWTVVVRLPDDNGATVDKVVAARKDLGGELSLDRARLHVEQVAGADDKTMRVSGFTADPFAEPVLCTPDMLADVDVWEQGIPVAVDAFGRVLFLRLKDVSILLGGSSRSGKGAALRLIIAGCLLDARVRLHLADGKHPGQNRWRGLTASYIWDPDKRAKQLAKRLEALVAEMGVRAARLAELGVESLEERPDLVGTEGLTLEVVVIDEVSAFTLDTKHGKKITRALIQLAARGLAFGIVLILATQLSTAGVLDRLITGNVVWRWCMYATDADGSNSILGKGMAGRGYSAHLLNPQQRGTGLLLREGQVSTVRSLWLDGDHMATVQDMVRALRAPVAQPAAPVPAQQPPAPAAPAPAAVPAPKVDWSVLEGWLNMAAPGPSAPAGNDPKAKALELIRQAGPQGIKRAEVAGALGASPNTVGGWLKAWTEQGLIEALGAPPHTRYVATDGRQ
ncbi:helix-turn-helix domain-containing protein [Streptomyces xanthophaeus]|uniref:helix-turn-helix domain-containing protein n=1 Tax=Streptomyces xanthophaeus TaxID=67385 RepID=UPI003711C6E5